MFAAQETSETRLSQRRTACLQLILDTYELLNREHPVDIRRLLFSRKQFADHLHLSKTFATPIVESLVADGVLTREVYKYNDSPKDQRKHWLYSLTVFGESVVLS